MLRKTSIIIPIILLALAGCSSKPKDTAVTGVQAPSVGAPAAQAPAAPPTASATPFACPTAATRKFAKTRFIANAGLAAGAFHRYIYAPHQKGAFKSGAQGQKRSIIKATAAGLFALDQLRRAKANVEASPGLCRVLAAPMTRLQSALQTLVAKFKRGEVDPSTIGAASGALEQTRGAAGSAGAGFKDKNVPANMIGG